MSRSTYIRTDVTAVAMYRDLIIAGIGSYMYVYVYSGPKVKQRLRCLNGQKIYGFKKQHTGSLFIVFGGKQFSVVKGLGEDDVMFTLVAEPVVCEDWLHSASWDYSKPYSVYFLTAHNVVLEYNIVREALVSRHISKDNSILYSGLLLALKTGVLVMAGTVYSEVILQVCGEDQPLHRLKGHKGVIFSISCHPTKDIIVTTSDDRSVRIWGPKCTPQVSWQTTDYWRNEIICKHELYGHNARVMRSSITDQQIISVGEDSRICFWTHNGVLVKKVNRHQNAGIWSIATYCDCVMITGGGDGAVTMQYLSSSSDECQKTKTLNLEAGKPRQVAFSATGNLFILYESNKFIYYNTNTCMTITVQKLVQTDETLVHTLSTSPSKKMCALAGWNSIIKIIVETDSSTIRLESIEADVKGLRSVHWAADSFLVASTESGLITLLKICETAKSALVCAVYELPFCKERWLTCAATNEDATLLIVGDRCGGIHLYKDAKLPIKSFSKLHGRYGPTSIMLSNNEVTTTGRDKTIKYYKISGDKMTHTGTKELDFHWVERILDVQNQVVCGFKEKMFVVYRVKTHDKILEISCGGAHRSYDLLYYYDPDDESIILKLLYLKNSTIHIETVTLTKIAVICTAMGSHSKEINCLKTHQVGGKTLFFSGGEDTTVRVSVLENELYFEDLVISKNLSSVRTLKMYAKDRDEILLISAGGRAQLCIKLFKINIQKTVQVDTRDLIDYMLKGTDKIRKGEKHWKDVAAAVDVDPETRIMDVDYVKNNDKYTIFAGCSDALLRVFVFKADKATFKIINESKYPKFCILKTVCVKYLMQDVLITCSTRGEVAFWDVTNVTKDLIPFFEMRTNKSGINSIVTRILDDKILIGTGGDDNALHLNVLHAPDRQNLSSMQVQYSLVLDKYHSSAVTGLCLVDDYILSTSIDQRITLYAWKVTDKITCNFISQTISDVADIKGIDLITQQSSSISVCVYGKGLEVFKIPTIRT